MRRPRWAFTSSCGTAASPATASAARAPCSVSLRVCILASRDQDRLVQGGERKQQRPLLQIINPVARSRHGHISPGGMCRLDQSFRCPIYCGLDENRGSRVVQTLRSIGGGLAASLLSLAYCFSYGAII